MTMVNGVYVKTTASSRKAGAKVRFIHVSGMYNRQLKQVPKFAFAPAGTTYDVGRTKAKVQKWADKQARKQARRAMVLG